MLSTSRSPRMRRTSVRTRVVSVIAALTVAGGGLLALAPPASAVTVISPTLTPTSQPTIYVGGTAEVGADWTTSSLATVGVGDNFAVKIDDNDGTANCAATGDSIG